MGEPAKPSSNRRKWWIALVGAICVLALWIPDPHVPVPTLPKGGAFLWDKDELFQRLEQRFVAQRATCPGDFEEQLAALQTQASELANVELETDPKLSAFEQRFFEVVASAGGCAAHVPQLMRVRQTARQAVKNASIRWPETRAARDVLYRILYGTRLAVEELLLQLPPQEALSLSHGQAEPSAAPWVEFKGVKIHSGDLLVSRGGAPTSAFIARGSDYPGSFSHVALVHIDAETKQVSVVESHIESGVGVSTADKYLDDKKLRILVLRLRADHPLVEAQPLLAHQAAERALSAAQQTHIPYDFAMNVADPGKQFCSEVASSNYRESGIQLWQRDSKFSSPGLARWMARLGVEHLETHGPSDLEYDPQLRVVAEWHDPETLFQDHVDNAVIDAMLEQAEGGAAFDYNWALLPVVRLAKAYSVVLNWFGGVGPVPEGMSATVALRAKWLSSRHEELKAQVLTRATEFQAKHGYRAPYWRLFEFAEAAAKAASWSN